MPTTTATVETLTAQVRVLMVGSRQVTLSVAKQLDHVTLDDLTVFGRVRFTDGMKVIGCDLNGNLALAEYRNEPTKFDAMLEDPFWSITTCRYLSAVTFAYRSEWIVIDNLVGRDSKLLINRKITTYCDRDHSKTCGRNGFQFKNEAANKELRAEIIRQFKEHNESEVEHKAAREAPLIVLAGLR